MNTRPNWFWTSLFTSITVNAVLFASAAAWLYSQTPIYIPGYPRSAIATGVDNDMPFPIIRDTVLGDSTGTGDATDASPGAELMEAAQGPQSQAFVSRDPEGPGKIGKDPAMSQQIPGENGNGEAGAPMFGAAMAQTPAPQPTFAPRTKSAGVTPAQKPREDELKDQAEQRTTEAQTTPVTETPVKIVKDANERPDTVKEKESPPAEAGSPEQFASIADAPDISPVRSPSIAPVITPVAPVQAPPAPPAPPTPPTPQAPSSTGGGKPGPSATPADPAPLTESESDPFSKNGAIKFKRGATDVQFGRKHKIIRPQLGLGAQTALLNLESPVTLTLALTLDETGNVISVIVLKSSGSKDIDQACKVAAYKWWLEPSRDKSGKAVRDVVPFTVGFS